MPRNENRESEVKKNEKVQVSAYSSGQCDDPQLSFENEGGEESAVSNTFKSDMGVPFQTSDHDYCIAPPRSTESSGMLEIKQLEIFLRKEIMSKIFQKKFPQGRTTRNRSICFLVVEPTLSILLLVIRSKQFSCRCTRTKVVT